MRFNHILLKISYVFMALLFCIGCSDDNEVDNREQDYGFVRFKLVKKETVPMNSIICAKRIR